MSDAYTFLNEMNKPSYVWFEDQRAVEKEAHRHNMAQFVYVAQGFQYLHTEENVYLLPQHYAAWIPAGTLHKTSSNADDLDLRSLFFHVDSTVPFYQNLHVFSAPIVLREMVAYAEKWNQNKMYDAAEDSFLQAIFTEMPEFSKQTLQLQLPTPSNQALQKISTYIHTHLLEDLSTSNLAALFYFSERSLQRLFKKETGLTLAKYIQYARVMKSCELLDAGRHSISEISYLVGYQSVPAFSSSFFAIVKQRPTAFLKKQQAKGTSKI